MQNKIVVRFKDNQVLKGVCNDFFPNKSHFHLQTIDGEVVEVEVEQLKAVFFIKDFAGDKHLKERYADTIPGAGRKMKVDFADGETVIGFSLGYSPDRKGFFLTPANKASNNERIFVVSSASENVAFI